MLPRPGGSGGGGVNAGNPLLRPLPGTGVKPVNVAHLFPVVKPRQHPIHHPTQPGDIFKQIAAIVKRVADIVRGSALGEKRAGGY